MVGVKCKEMKLHIKGPEIDGGGRSGEFKGGGNLAELREEYY